MLGFRVLPDLGPSVLSQRLRDLEDVGVIRRRRLSPPAGSQVYELTDWGAELEPVFRALARWGMRSPVLPLAGEVSADSVMLGLRTFFDSQADPNWTSSYEVRLERDSYHRGTGRCADRHRSRRLAGSVEQVAVPAGRDRGGPGHHHR
ncbi:MAG: helix-turn-helix transcriptional regulator [Geodermatophilaceae bacterium]|nr:helix-turn-helix transcriptional regulator [Geodermatophilaceae bacterium]